MPTTSKGSKKASEIKLEEGPKVSELYGGKVKVEFFGPSPTAPKRHKYVVNGESPVSVTSVTGILDKPALKFWSVKLMKEFLLACLENGNEISEATIEEAARQHTIKTEQEATSGSQVHEWAEMYIKGHNPEMPRSERVINGVNGFLKWVDEHKVKFTSSEKLVYSKKYGYVGLMDATFTMGTEGHKKNHGGDFKTGSWKKEKNRAGEIVSEGPYDEHRFQVRGYVNADIEESGCEYDGDWIIYFDKDTGDFRAFHLPEEEREKDTKAFLSLLTVKKRQAELK